MSSGYNAVPDGPRRRGFRRRAVRVERDWEEGDIEPYFFDPGEFTGSGGEGDAAAQIEEIHRSLPGSRLGLSYAVLGSAALALLLWLYSHTVWAFAPAGLAVLATGVLAWFHVTDRADRARRRAALLGRGFREDPGFEAEFRER
ncbi:hypothetical protein RMN57_21215 [Kitasatospora sp. CM 4170]|uniref:Integral membrane protein n=1 Tax=Kitasatospora aburaviensis TaxID=67265 RepID=A0ABW1EYD9_9ACTN|nr:hypothetical protein [Kitasatospora sp. CM 4170]WNM47046.1 hypothetical protein RMN57_21215 [Kitasatospora sp. CM 4170]